MGGAAVQLNDVQIRVNARPSETELSNLCEAVGWSRFGGDFRALDSYTLTTSAWTDEGRLIGWTSIVSDNVRHAFLLDVMVHPQFQRRGIGKAVVLRAIQEMRTRGVTTVHVDCHPDQAGFYARCGFMIGAGGWLNCADNS